MESAYQNAMWLAWWQDSDWVVRSLFLLLIALSVVSWAIIFLKSWHLGALDRSERRLARALTSGEDTVRDVTTKESGPLSARLVRHTLAIAGTGPFTETDRQALREHLDQEISQARLQLESQLTVLASIGSSAPFIGLLGTVWGIMHALGSLHGAEALSLDQVAGPVGEALVATAAGLFTAIPAVVAYNLLVRRLRRVGTLLGINTLRLLDGRLRGPWAVAPGAGSARGD
jgi:biopolymer transport protein ExbB